MLQNKWKVVIKLNYREKSDLLQDSYSIANNRLRTLVNRCKENRDFHSQYNDIETHNSSIAERVNKNE